MVRTCTVCSHKDVEEINMLLLSGESYRSIAKRFEASESAIYRHKESHIPTELLKSTDIEEIANADNLQQQLKEIREKTNSLLDKAEAAGNTKAYGAPSNYLREIREQIKLWAELEGRLATQPQINILINPQWVELRTLIIKALEPYPEAKAEVLRAIG
jgi:hypothetical protein